jgi:V/A-type H+-transporting ATPase subunit I
VSIVPLARVTLCGLLAERDAMLRDLQTLGVAHLLSPGGPDDARAATAPASASSAREALHYLRGAANRWHQVHDPQGFGPRAVEERALAVRRQTRDLEDERLRLERRIRDLEPWGDFALLDPASIEHRLWFYRVPNHQLPSVPAGLVWQAVHRDEQGCYVVVISPEEPVGMPVARTHTGSRRLSDLRRRLESLQVEIDALQAERDREARWCDLFAASLDHLEDEAEFVRAQRLAADDAPVFVLHAWVPEHALGDLQRLATRRAVAVLARRPAADDDPPTQLANRGLDAAGQDLLSFFMVPHYSAWDPSRSVFWFFCVFFALMMSDAGYATLLAAALGLGWRHLGRSALGLRMRGLALVAVSLALAWGIAVGSYFGVPAAAHSLPGRLVMFDTSDLDAWLTLAVMAGVVQIAFATLGRAASASTWRARIVPLGWFGVVAGGCIAWLANESTALPAAAPAGSALAVAGLSAVAVFASERRGLLNRAMDGLLALTRVVGLFSDVLSYLRLFALALAGAALARAFNDLGSSLEVPVPGLGELASLFIILFGHALNLGLCAASAIVHSLRLNLIEYLHWSLDDEGHPFTPFLRKERLSWTSS